MITPATELGLRDVDLFDRRHAAGADCGPRARGEPGDGAPAQGRGWGLYPRAAGGGRAALAAHAQRGRLIQGALTRFYLALGLFVATTASIGAIAVVGRARWLPSLPGIAGTVVLFYGSVLLIVEARLALQSVEEEMQFT